MPRQSFSKRLLKWHTGNPRQHPWKETKNPYNIWVSEIILQQTKVEAGTPYYLKFIQRFPDIASLASADLDDVYALWTGLGYYSRARNLHASAKRIMKDFGGKFPTNYEDILTLKGVGPYTAAAISSFAYDLPTPVLDGNVKRVIARHYGFEQNVMKSTASKELFSILETKYFDPKQPSAFNQAIMDFGALVCKPKQPDCTNCMVAKDCYALAEGKTKSLPVRNVSIVRKDRYFHYIVLRNDTHALFKKREEKDIWQNLFDFPLIETQDPSSLDKKDILKESKRLSKKLSLAKEIRVSGPKSQLLSHQRIIARFYSLYLENLEEIEQDNLYLFELENKSNFAIPKVVDWYLKDKSIYLFS